MMKFNLPIITVVLSHFSVAFVILGMAPFFPIILEKSFDYTNHGMIGLIYALPIFLTGLCGPLWGRFADQYGKKLSLMRALIGLAISFAIAGYSHSVTLFIISLIIQGIMGGTMSAASAYIATIIDGKALSRCLTLMQASARLSFIVAPIVFGYFMSLKSPVSIYQYLLYLPVISLFFLFLIGFKTKQLRPQNKNELKIIQPKKITHSYNITEISLINFLFALAVVTTYPYFIIYLKSSSLKYSYELMGFLFGLPHIIYLLFSKKLSPIIEGVNYRSVLIYTFLLLGLSILVQGYIITLPILIIARIIMGICITIVYIALHGMLSEVSTPESSGKVFSWYDLGSKFGGVVAGIISGAIVHYSNYSTTFVFAMLASTMAMFYMLYQKTKSPNKFINNEVYHET